MRDKNTKSALIPAEWAEQKALWTCWPSVPDLWAGDLLDNARGEIAAMVRAVAAHQTVKVLAYGAESLASARAMLDGVADIIPVPFGDIWLRDTGPIFTATGAALRFATNGWGGKYIYEHDDTVGDVVAEHADAPIIRHNFVLEGGALDHNGAGVILTTRQCLLNPNRNGWNEKEAENALKAAFDAQKILWLDEGMLNDHTDGHVDNLARFVDENTVLCQSAFGADDPNAALHAKTARDLRAAGVNVVQMPSPGLITDEDEAITPASHMNFIITNKVVVVPTYGAESTQEALEILRSLFPTREIIGLPASAVLTGGGSFHCITQQEPSV